MPADELKKKLRETAAQGGRIVVDSSILEAAAAANAPAKMVPVAGPVVAAVPQAALDDKMVTDAVSSGGKLLSRSAAESADDTANKALTPDFLTSEMVELTEEEREIFLESLISGKRYEQRFTIFNGKVRGKIRCRSAAESEAIAAWMNMGIRDKKYAASLEYALELRNIMLTAQVAELNGIRYVEMLEPLFRTQRSGVTEEPGWRKDSESWVKQPESILTGIYEELRIFEKKYWAMISHARDQNFWLPVGSILV